MSSSDLPERRRTPAALPRSRRKGITDWVDLGVAVMELALARLRLALAAPESFVRGETTGSNGNFDTRRFKRIARVQHAIARAAHRVPWRSDCLVQALAAQHWLGRHGIPTALSLGVRKDMPTDFEAHAWLMAGDRIVTGGDIGSYTKLIGDGDRPAR